LSKILFRKLFACSISDTYMYSVLYQPVVVMLADIELLVISVLINVAVINKYFPRNSNVLKCFAAFAVVTLGFDGRQFSLRIGPTSPVWHWFLRRQISRRVYNQMNDKHLHFILQLYTTTCITTYKHSNVQLHPLHSSGSVSQ
jgi:hypothetical protein